MKSKSLRLLICILILAVVSLSCSTLSKDPTPTTAPSDTPEPPATLTPEAPPTPETVLGDQVRVEEGGFAFKPIPEYSLDTASGIASMMPAGADPDLGPMIMMIGGVAPENTSAQDTLDSMQAPDLTIANVSPAMIGGLPGLKADISRPAGDLLGQVFVIIVSPTQQFVALAGSPPDQWDGLKQQFKDVLDTVSFFEPVVQAAEPVGQGSEIRQWASSASASSSYGETAWSASQATGAPDVFECGDNSSAWASYNTVGTEWLELTYATPVTVSEVNIYETYNADYVSKVELVDINGGLHEIYTNVPMSFSCPYTLTIPVFGSDFQAVGVRITVDQTTLNSWNEIDAVEIVGTP